MTSDKLLVVLLQQTPLKTELSFRCFIKSAELIFAVHNHNETSYFGASGSGVTTLGLALADTLSMPYFDSDEYYWKSSHPPFTQKRDPQERNQNMRSDLHRNADWILGGSIISWDNDVFPDFDLVVFLHLPKAVRMERLKRREFERYGDIIYNDPDRNKQYLDFVAWAADYDENSGIANRNIVAHRKWLASVKAPVLLIEGDFSVEERKRLVLDRLREEKLL